MENNVQPSRFQSFNTAQIEANNTAFFEKTFCSSVNAKRVQQKRFSDTDHKDMTSNSNIL